MSIDLPGAQQFNYKSSDNFNYIDCYIEYFAEVVMKYENAIPESKTRHHRELQQHRRLQVCQITGITTFANLLVYENISKLYFIHSDKRAHQFIKEINPPPPKLSRLLNYPDLS